MKIRHIYHPGLIVHTEKEQSIKYHQFLDDSFFRQLSSRNDFVNNNSIFVIVNVHIPKQTNQYHRDEIKTVFEWFRTDSKILHIIQFIREHFDFDISKYILRNEDDNKIFKDVNEALPTKERIIFSFKKEVI